MGNERQDWIEFTVLHESSLCLAHDVHSWALPLSEVKEIDLQRMNADVGRTGTSLILLLDFDKDKGIGELAGGRKAARKPR